MSKALIVGEIYCSECSFCALHQDGECMYASMNLLSYFRNENGKLWCSNMMALQVKPTVAPSADLLPFAWSMFCDALDTALTLPDESLIRILVAATRQAWLRAVELLRPGVGVCFILPDVCVLATGEVFRKPPKAADKETEVADGNE